MKWRYRNLPNQSFHGNRRDFCTFLRRWVGRLWHELGSKESTKHVIDVVFGHLIWFRHCPKRFAKSGSCAPEFLKQMVDGGELSTLKSVTKTVLFNSFSFFTCQRKNERPILTKTYPNGIFLTILRLVSTKFAPTQTWKKSTDSWIPTFPSETETWAPCLDFLSLRPWWVSLWPQPLVLCIWNVNWKQVPRRGVWIREIYLDGIHRGKLGIFHGYVSLLEG